jgi:hypothetical protein
MKRLLILLPLLLVGGVASAIERHNASQMTCEAVQSALQSEGKAILRRPSSRVPGMALYDVYAANRAACRPLPNGAVWATAETSGSNACPLYRCVQIVRSTPRAG